jgi:VanZ family protein
VVAPKSAAEKRRFSFFARLPVSPRLARRWAVIWGLFLLALTSWPSPPEVPVVSQIPDFDKLVHGVLYGVEGFLLYFAIAWPGAPRFSWMRAATVAAAVAVWGTLDEIHQYWIPGRSMEAADALADTTAGFLGALIASRVSLRLTPPSPPNTSPRAGPSLPAPSPTASRSSGS